MSDNAQTVDLAPVTKAIGDIDAKIGKLDEKYRAGDTTFRNAKSSSCPSA